MAQALQIGERVMVKKGFRLKPDSAGYQQGLKSVGPSLVGEVAGPAPEGRAVLVSFNGIQVPVTKLNLGVFVNPRDRAGLKHYSAAFGGSWDASCR